MIYYKMGTKLVFIEVMEKNRKAIVLSKNSAHRREDLMYMYLQIEKTSIMDTEGLQLHFSLSFSIFNCSLVLLSINSIIQHASPSLFIC